jgi:hypothetical protein
VSVDFIPRINQGHKQKRVQSFLEQLPLLYMVPEQMSSEYGGHLCSSACFIDGITEQILMKFIIGYLLQILCTETYFGSYGSNIKPAINAVKISNIPILSKTTYLHGAVSSLAILQPKNSAPFTEPPKFHSPLYKTQPVHSTPNQVSPVRITIPCLFKISCNIILPSTSVSSNGSFSFKIF